MNKTFSLLFVFLLFAVVTIAQIRGKVVGIADGDSFTLLTSENKQLKIRLHGIDCPEKKAAFGQKAKAFTSDLIFGKYVTIKQTAKDRYRRTVAIVYLPDGRILNEELLKAGMAWHYRQHDKNPRWSKMEQQARIAKRGLWQAPHPVPPWEYRKRMKKGRSVKQTQAK